MSNVFLITHYAYNARPMGGAQNTQTVSAEET